MAYYNKALVALTVLLFVVAEVRGAADTCTAARTIASLPYEYEAYTESQAYSNYTCDLFNLFTRSQGMWFKYAGGNNYVTANTCSDDTDFDTIIYVFSSCSTAGAASTCVTYNEDYCDSQSSVTWAALSGTMYYIFVTGFGTTTGHFMLEVTESTPSTNDQCSSATEISSLPYVAEGVTDAVTLSNASCTGSYFPGLWYTIVGTGAVFRADTCDDSTDMDTIIHVYDSGCSSCLLYNDDSCGTRSAVVWDTEVGLVYYIYVTGYNGARGTFTLNVYVPEAEPYDTCQDAYTITSLPFVYSGTEANMPTSYSACGATDRHTFWFSVHGTGTTLHATTCGLDNYVYDTIIEVYGFCVNNVGTTCITSNDDYCGVHALVSFDTVDKDYFIAVSGFRGNLDGGNFTLYVNEATDIENGQCWGATPIDSLPYDVSQSTANVEYLSYFGCEEEKTARFGRWYEYTHIGPSAVIMAETCNDETVLHTVVEVYNSCNGGSCVAASNHSCGNQSSAKWTAYSGEAYYIFVTGDTLADTGFFHLDVYTTEATVNSYCHNAIGVPSLPFTVKADTLTALFTYSSCDGYDKQGLWYVVTGTGNKINAHTCNSLTDFDTRLEVYTSCSNASSACFTYNDDSSSCGTMSSVSWQSVADTLYYVYATGYGANTGVFVLDIVEEVSPTNAQCTGAIEVSSYPATYNGYTLYADYSWADCTSGSRQGLWYKLQTYNQNIQVSTCNDNTNFDTELEVYHDCNTTSGGGVLCQNIADDRSCTASTEKASVSWYAESAGSHQSTYYVYVTGLDGATGFVTTKFIDVDATSSDNNNNGLSGGAIAGAVIGTLIGVGLLGVGGYFGYTYYKKRYPQGYSIINN